MDVRRVHVAAPKLRRSGRDRRAGLRRRRDGGGDRAGRSTFARYDPVADSWETLQRMPEAVRAGSGRSSRRRALRHRWQHGRRNLERRVCLDPETDGWSERASLPEPRFNHSAVALDGEIYVLGGFNEGRSGRRCTSTIRATDTWSDGPSLPFPNHAFDAVAFHDEIWMIGGRRGEEVLSDRVDLNPRPASGARGRRCPRGWSCSVRPWPATRFTRSGEHVPDLRRRGRGVDDGPQLARRAARSADVLRRRHARHRRRLHDPAARQPGRRATQSPGALTSGDTVRLSSKWPLGQNDVRPLMN